MRILTKTGTILFKGRFEAFSTDNGLPVVVEFSGVAPEFSPMS